MFTLKWYRSFLISVIIFIFIFNTNIYAMEPMPDIKGTSAITVDVHTKEIIYSKNIDKKMYPASTTKLLTAILLSENKKPTDLLTYSDKAKSKESYSLDINVKPIEVNDKFTAEDAMNAMLLVSANDIAYMIGENIGGSEKDFSKLLNDEVSKLNLKNTHFVTCTGLHDKNHYSTAYDLSVIGRNLYNYPWVLNSLSLDKTTLKTASGNSMEIKNKNKLLNKNGCIAGKTGYTSEAGRCLVSLYDRNGRKIVGVVMNSIYDINDKTVFEDMEKIVNWSYNAKKDPLIKKDSIVETKNLTYNILPMINYKKSIDIPVIVKEDINVYKDSEYISSDINIEDIHPWKLNKNTPIGTICIKGRDWSREYSLYPTISKKDIFKDNALFYTVFIILLILIIYLINKIFTNKKRTYHY